MKKPDEFIKELSESLFFSCQRGLEKLVASRNIIFGYADLLYCKCQKINLKRGGSIVDSPNWIKIKKVRINPKISDDKYFQYAVTTALSQENFGKDPKRISKINPFINKFNWKEKEINQCKMFEKNNPIIALNIFVAKYNILKHNLKHEKLAVHLTRVEEGLCLTIKLFS